MLILAQYAIFYNVENKYVDLNINEFLIQTQIDIFLEGYTLKISF
ncbi:hypothetical protein [Clostridioides sp. ES-S-0054-01]